MNQHLWTSTDRRCAVSIGSGYYEITDENTDGCVGVNSETNEIVVESSAACAVNGGLGYQWDEWTTISYNDGGHTVWQFLNVYTAECMYDDLQQPAIQASCVPTDKFEWFYWPDSGL